MKKNLPGVSLPPWFVAGLSDQEDRGAAVSYRHEYMKEDFLQAVAIARKKLNPMKAMMRKGMDGFFSTRGAMLDLCEQMLRITIPPVPVMATRSGNSEGTHREWRLIDGFGKPVDGRLLQVATVMADGQMCLQINLLNPESGLEIRPFSLEIRDNENTLLQDWLEIAPGMLPPLFPAPRPGVYCCTVVWVDGRAATDFEFVAESNNNG